MTASIALVDMIGFLLEVKEIYILAILSCTRMRDILVIFLKRTSL